MNESDKRNRSKESWSHFLEYNQRQWKKVAGLGSAALAIFTAGITVGVFYQSLQNKFEISDLKTKHNAEVQNIRNEYTQEQLREMKSYQMNFDRINVSEKEGDHEK